MKLALVGYMGSGKSFWAEKTAKALRVSMIDLDTFLEQQHLKMNVPDFIYTHGELAFRKLERLALQELCSLSEDFVLATGGGTPCYYENMQLLNKHFTTVYLQATINTLYNRLVKEKDQRPLISHITNDTLKEFIAKHLFERRVFYSLANYKVDVEELTLDKLINTITHA